MSLQTRVLNLSNVLFRAWKLKESLNDAPEWNMYGSLKNCWLETSITQQDKILQVRKLSVPNWVSS